MTSSRHARWAETCFAALTTAYPYEASHRSASPDDCDVTPARLHPAFHGAFDWHSSVHMQWSLITLTDSHPDDVPEAARVLLADRLTPTALATEISYLRKRRTFERPYGWGWAARLAAAVSASDAASTQALEPATRPLADAIAELTDAWLSSSPRAIRHGLHANSAFCLTLLYDAYRTLGYRAITEQIRDAATRWYGDDVDVDTRYEPSGSDIFSPALSEAALMSRVLSRSEFLTWLERFLPGFADGRGENLLTPPAIQDTDDGAATHWSGLAFSRAAQLRGISRVIDDERTPRLLRSADAHVRAAEPVVSDGDFMSTHWLVSFALLAEETRVASPGSTSGTGTA